MTTRVYLDVCAIQRPLDSPSQIRIVLESEAVLGIITLCEAEQLEIVSSDALIYEIEQNPLPVRKEYARAVLQAARERIRLSEAIRTRAAQLVQSGFKSLDALHLALAEAGQVDYFCTCDDRLLRRAKRMNLRVKVVSPLELVQEIEK